MAKLPDMLSVSQLNRFMSCPLSYKFKYVDGIDTGTKSSNLALGTAVHAAAQRLHEDIMNGCIGEAQTYSDACASALDTEGCYDVVMKPGEDEQTLKAAGQGLVDVYYEYRLANPVKIVACEHKLQGELVNVESGETLDVPFVGYLDLLEEGQDGMVIVDLKTACRSYSQGDIDESIQLTAYAMMLAQEQGGVIPQCRVDAIIRNKTPKMQTLHTNRTQLDFVRFFSLAASVRRSICLATEHDAFYPNRGWMCPTCEFAGECWRWGG